MYTYIYLCMHVCIYVYYTYIILGELEYYVYCSLRPQLFEAANIEDVFLGPRIVKTKSSEKSKIKETH